MASHSNVVVNFGINANASGGVNVFGSGTTPSLTGLDVIVADVSLPVSDFYATSNALISYQGSNDDIIGVLDGTFQRSNALATDINTMLGGAFGCSNAIPYSYAKYSNLYNTQSNFGMFALGYYADKLFGHLAATAAIANDSTFISYMNGAGSNSADLGTLLSAGVYSMSSANATNIAKQVLGQDASRAMNADNDVNTPNTFQPLKWISGDVIYMGVTLMPPTVTYNSGQLQRLTSITTSNTYYVKITLGDGTGGVLSGVNFSEPTSLRFVINNSTLSNSGSTTLSGSSTQNFIVIDQDGNNVTSRVTLSSPNTALGLSGASVTPTAAGTYTLTATYGGSVTSTITVNVVASSVSLKYASDNTAVGSSMTINDQTLEVQLLAVDDFGTNVSATSTWARTNNGADSVINVTTTATTTDGQGALPTINANTKGVIAKLAPGQDVLTVTYGSFTASTTVTVANYLRVAWSNQDTKTYRIMNTNDALGLNYYNWSGTAWSAAGTTPLVWTSADAAKVSFSAGSAVASTTSANPTFFVKAYSAGFANAVAITVTNGTLNGKFTVIHT